MHFLEKQKSQTQMRSGFGAAGQTRTADLVITNDVLYHLSYSSIFFPADYLVRGNLATEKGLEPSASSVTGWRSNRLNYSAKFFVLRCFAWCLTNITDRTKSVNTFFQIFQISFSPSVTRKNTFSRAEITSSFVILRRAPYPHLQSFFQIPLLIFQGLC